MSETKTKIQSSIASSPMPSAGGLGELLSIHKLLGIADDQDNFKAVIEEEMLFYKKAIELLREDEELLNVVGGVLDRQAVSIVAQELQKLEKTARLQEILSKGATDVQKERKENRKRSLAR